MIDSAARRLASSTICTGRLTGLPRERALQKAWVANDVPQCGYCQSGMIMAATALLKTKPKPTDADIDAAITNICRCGTYNRVRAAIKEAAGGPKTGSLDIVHIVRAV